MMSDQGDPLIQKRLAALMKEVSQDAAAQAPLRPGRSRAAAINGLRGGMVKSAVVSVLALLIGIQLGALPWRYRRELWQAQGLLIGLAAGVVIGRLSARRPGDD